MYKFPLRLPHNLDPILTQGFRAEEPLDMSTMLSTSTRFHNGVDVVCGTNEQTWGRECVWPFPWPGTVYDSRVDSPLGAKQFARAQIGTTDPDTGIAYSIIYLHLSAVAKTKGPTDTNVIVYQQGETIGKMGNNGFVNPKPTPERPLDGSHLHLGLGVKKPGEINYTMVDPLQYFDISDPYRSETVPYYFNRDLYFGIRGQDVVRLQERLGVFPTYPQFGPKTLQALVKYQQDHGIRPAVGFCGEITRASLNNA